MSISGPGSIGQVLAQKKLQLSKHSPLALAMGSRLSMSRSLVSRFARCFFLHRGFCFVLGFVAPHVALHRVSIRTLEKPASTLARCLLGSRGESMLPFVFRS